MFCKKLKWRKELEYYSYQFKATFYALFAAVFALGVLHVFFTIACGLLGIDRTY